MAIFGALIFHRWKDPGVNRSEWPLAAATQIDGPTSRVRVDAIFLDCFMSWVELTFSFTIASIASVMFDLNWIKPGQC